MKTVAVDSSPSPLPQVSHAARWWRLRADSRIECFLCPRSCKLSEGQRGFCGVRQRVGDRLMLRTYGRTGALCVDPVEKKPLYHFLPGSRILSLGTAGCNLGCSFCQNWGLSRARDEELLSRDISPQEIARVALRESCRSVAFTYNEPIVFAEFALDAAQACHECGLKTVAVTAGYITSEARADFFSGMDAANVDLKGFSNDFYRRRCRGRLQPVLDTLAYLHRETSIWLEVTTLLIPGENDGEEELRRAVEWYSETLGPDVPWHFSAFHPDYRLRDKPRTSMETLCRAREIAMAGGIRYVYLGNVMDAASSRTFCPQCGQVLIERDGFMVLRSILHGNRCPGCGAGVPGLFE